MEKHILKKIAWLYMACAMVMPVVVLTGCSDDDDDDDGGNASAETLSEVSAFTGTDGSTLYLTTIYSGSYTEYSIEYDEDGIMTSWNDDTKLTSTSPLKYEYDDGEDEGNDTETFKNFNTNSSGYLTSYDYEEAETWSDGDYDKGSASISLSYNSNGQLTKITSSGSYKEYYADDNETYTESFTTTTTLTWENNLITQAVSTTTWKDSDGDSGTYTETWVYAYDTEYENATLQYPYYDNEAFDCIYYTIPSDEPFLFIGWFGKGPEYLPSSYTYSYYYDEDDEVYSGSYNKSFSYTFNSDGSIHYDGRYYYAYQDDVTEKSLTFTELSDKETTKADSKTKRHFHSKHKAKRAAITSAEE